MLRLIFRVRYGRLAGSIRYEFLGSGRGLSTSICNFSSSCSAIKLFYDLMRKKGECKLSDRLQGNLCFTQIGPLQLYLFLVHILALLGRSEQAVEGKGWVDATESWEIQRCAHVSGSVDYVLTNSQCILLRFTFIIYFLYLIFFFQAAGIRRDKDG